MEIAGTIPNPLALLDIGQGFYTDLSWAVGLSATHARQGLAAGLQPASSPYDNKPMRSSISPRSAACSGTDGLFTNCRGHLLGAQSA